MNFNPLKDQDIAAHLIDVHKGHDTFIISKTLTRIYYIIEGSGVFTIDNQKYDVGPGSLRCRPQESPHFENGVISRLFGPHAGRKEGPKVPQ